MEALLDSYVRNNNQTQMRPLLKSESIKKWEETEWQTKSSMQRVW